MLLIEVLFRTLELVQEWRKVGNALVGLQTVRTGPELSSKKPSSQVQSGQET